MHPLVTMALGAQGGALLIGVAVAPASAKAITIAAWRVPSLAVAMALIA